MGVLYLDNNNYFFASFSHTLPILSLRNIIFPLFAELLSCRRYYQIISLFIVDLKCNL